MQSNLESLSCILKVSDNLDAALLIILPLLLHAALTAVTLVENRADFYVSSVRARRTNNGMPRRMRRTGRIVYRAQVSVTLQNS